MSFREEVGKLFSRGKRREEFFNSVIESTRDMLFRMVRRMVERESVAEEILQECYLSLWDRLDGGVPANPEAWLVRACVNRSIDHLRRRDIRGETALEEETLATPCFRDAGPGSWEVEALLDSALRRLAPREKAAFMLRKIEGCSYEDIAQMTGVAAATVRNQVMNAGRKIEKALREGGIEP